MAKQEQIYTIPVNDAFHQVERCPLCALEKLQEETLIDFYLGPSLMEADHRIVTNEKGFCPEHLAAMYKSQKNRLGLGLMLHTYLQEHQKRTQAIFDKAKPEEMKRSFFRRSTGDWKENLTDAATAMQAGVDSCVICDRLKETMERYREVIFYQFSTDKDFRAALQNGHPMCMHHLAFLLEGAGKHLKQAEALEFVQLLEEKHMQVLQELTGDVEWFTLKFDYKNQDKPWKNSKDALPRAIKQLEGDKTLS